MWLARLLIALLPATACEHFLEAVRRMLCDLLRALVEDDGRPSDLSPDDLAVIDAHLAWAEAMLRAGLGMRVCELNGLSKRRLSPPPFACPQRGHDSSRNAARLLARLKSLAQLLSDFEMLARRRAEAVSQDPLRLDASRRSTSPASRWRQHNRRRPCLHRHGRGRWIAASSRRDGATVLVMRSRAGFGAWR